MSVIYHYLSEEDEGYDVHFRGAACFSSVRPLDRERMPKCIHYEAKASCGPDLAMFWLAFIAEWLDEDRFIAIPRDEANHGIDFYLDTSDMNGYQALAYLTVFRYVDEFTHCVEFVHDLQKQFDATPDMLFIALCDIHAKGKEQGYGAGHAIGSTWAGEHRPGMLTIDEFQERIIDDDITSVYGFFAKSTRKSILDQKVDPCF